MQALLIFLHLQNMVGSYVFRNEPYKYRIPLLVHLLQ